jgi:hypothetical protein
MFSLNFSPTNSHPFPLDKKPKIAHNNFTMKIAFLIVWTTLLGIVVSPLLAIFLAGITFFTALINYWKGSYRAWIEVKQAFEKQKADAKLSVWERHQARLDATDLTPKNPTKNQAE